MSRRQISVTDGEAGHKGEIKSVINPPSLYVPNVRVRPMRKEPRTGSARPRETAEKLYEEDAPDLPGSH
jgi:hypothetical protein